MYQSGKLKRRIRPSDVTINIGKDAEIPECPIPGERFVLHVLFHCLGFKGYWAFFFPDILIFSCETI